MAIVFDMSFELGSRYALPQPETKDVRITELLLRGQYGPVLHWEPVFRQSDPVTREIGHIAKTNVSYKRLGAGSDAKVFSLCPVQQIMAATEAGSGIVGDLVLFISGLAQYILRQSIHFDLQQFIRLLPVRSVYLVSESGPLFHH